MGIKDVKTLVLSDQADSSTFLSAWLRMRSPWQQWRKSKLRCVLNNIINSIVCDHLNPGNKGAAQSKFRHYITRFGCFGAAATRLKWKPAKLTLSLLGSSFSSMIFITKFVSKGQVGKSTQTSHVTQLNSWTLNQRRVKARQINLISQFPTVTSIIFIKPF